LPSSERWTGGRRSSWRSIGGASCAVGRDRVVDPRPHRYPLLATTCGRRLSGGTEFSARHARHHVVPPSPGSRAVATRNHSGCPASRGKCRLAGTSHAGGGPPTPDTRIMIPLRFGSTEPERGWGDPRWVVRGSWVQRVPAGASQTLVNFRSVLSARRS
jgi:hypothetical protein